MSKQRRVLAAVAILALVGCAAAGYVFVAHSLGYALICPFATGCDAVQASPYAVLFGLPVSLLGLLAFTALLLCAVLGWRHPRAAGACLHVLLVLALVDLGFTAYMAYLQVNVIRAICSWCMLSAGLTMALSALIVFAQLARWRGR